jgi:hypothetical protein
MIERMRRYRALTLAAVTLTLAALFAPATPVGAQTPTGPQGLIAFTEFYPASAYSSSGAETAVATLNVTLPPDTPRCVRIHATIRLQTSLAGTTADVFVRRLTYPGPLVVAGQSFYMPLAGGAGAASYHPAGIDEVGEGTTTYVLYIKRTAGSGTVTTGQTQNALAQFWIEDVGDAFTEACGMPPQGAAEALPDAA